MKKTLVVLIVLLLLILAVVALLDLNKETAQVSSFEECVEAGNPVMESYPRQCRSAEGKLFVEEISIDTNLTVGETVTVTGNVNFVDSTAVPADGPTLIEVNSVEKGVVTIAVPSMGINLCPAQENIMDLQSISEGDVIEVSGIVSEQNQIVPCEDAAHFLREAVSENEDVSEVTLGVGEAREVNGLTLAFNEFVQDSRCPVDGQCSEAGGVTVNVTLASDEEAETRNLASDEVPYEFSGYKISIPEVSPDRMLNQDIAQEDYRVTFFVETIEE